MSGFWSSRSDADTDFRKALPFTDTSLNITLRCGQEPTLSYGGRPCIGPGTMKDVAYCSRCVDTFANALLKERYGRYWQRSSSAWFSFLGIAEAKARDGINHTYLHFHCILDGSGLGGLTDIAANQLVGGVWRKISLRYFHHDHGAFVERARSADGTVLYAQKNLDEMSPVAGGIIMKRNCPLADPLTGTGGLASIHFNR